MRQEDGRLFATARAGSAHLNAYLDDYAFMVQALLDLYESDFDRRWLEEALALDRILFERFEDDERGGYFTTARDHERLLARLKSVHDAALPSGSGVQALNLLRLAELTGRRELAVRAEGTIRSVGELANRFPASFSQLLIAVDFLSAEPREIVIAGGAAERSTGELLRALRSSFAPHKVVALASAEAPTDLLPILEGKTSSPGHARAYICRNRSCGMPLEDAAQLRAALAT
jgi:uncharacterized protein YyaL (SSP411 family)